MAVKLLLGAGDRSAAEGRSGQSLASAIRQTKQIFTPHLCTVESLSGLDEAKDTIMSHSEMSWKEISQFSQGTSGTILDGCIRHHIIRRK